MPSVESDEQAEASTAENAQTATDIFRLTAKIDSPLSAIRRGAVTTEPHLLPPPFRLDCRPERRERDAELSGDVSPPNRPPSRLPGYRALRAGEDDPVLLRWTLLSGPLMADRSIVKYTAIHRENTSSSKPSVKMAVKLSHGNNRCIVQQSLQSLGQERRQRDGPCSGLPPPPMASQARLAAHRPFLSSLSPRADRP